MKYIYLSLLFFTAGTLYSYAAERIISLDADQKNLAGTYIARDTIFLLPDYEFTGDTGKEMEAWIDETLITLPNYVSAGALPDPNRSLNTSYAIGTTLGDADVTTQGAATYTIPIQISPGTSGVEPSISISYNSQSRDGLLGYGWSLGGISSITRTGKSIYHDEKAEAVLLDNTDNIMLDGQRLLKISGNNLEEGSRYRTEIESYRDITIKNKNGRIYFEVIGKDGAIFRYGDTEDSYIEAQGKNEAFFWLLSRVTDVHGNYITYSYEEKNDLGEFYIKRIDYTGNDSINMAPYARVEFFYETRSDTLSSYLAGCPLKTTVQLRKIKSYYNDDVFREYNFKYVFDRYWSKLVEIEEYNNKNERFNSTVISWDSPPSLPSLVYPKVYNIEGAPEITNCHEFFADFDGDGINDILQFRKLTDYRKDNYGTQDSAVLYKGYLVDDFATGQKKAYYKKKASFCLAIMKDLLFGDFNGDGYLDAIRVSQGSEGYYYYFILFDGNNFSEFREDRKVAESKVYDPYVGDFNGDGKDELLVTEGMYDYTGKNIGKSEGLWFFERDMGQLKHKITRLDFNGNGKTDIFITLPVGGSCVYEYNGTKFEEIMAIPEIQTKNYQEWLEGEEDDSNIENLNLMFAETFFGDLNGDGKTDVFSTYKGQFGYGNRYTTIFYSTGKDFVKSAPYQENSPGKTTSSTSDKFFIVDVNRDGKEDVLYCMKVNGKLLVDVYISDGLRLHYYGRSQTEIDIPHDLWLDYLMSVDFLGNGKAQIGYYGWSNAIKVCDLILENENLLVTSVTNGLNQRVNFEYLPLSDATVYKKTNTYSYPVRNDVYPLYVVSKQTQRDKKWSVFSECSYKYGKMGTHMLGKGWLGFAEIEIYNSVENKMDSVKYHINTTEYTPPFLSEKKTFVYSEATGIGAPISTIEYNYVYSPNSAIADKYYYLASSSVDETDHLTGLNSKKNYSYQDGNISVSKEKTGGITTEIQNVWIATNNRFKNSLQSSTTTSYLNGVAKTENKKTYLYDDKNRVISYTNYANTRDSVTVRYTDSDSFGNFQTITTSANDCLTTTEHKQYDEQGRFVVSLTDALNNEERYINDPCSGKVLRIEHSMGLISEFAYDGFGNLKSKKFPDGILTTYSWQWSNDVNVLYKEEITSSDMKNAKIIYYDGLCREIEKEVPGFGGTIYAKKSYRYDGRIEWESIPSYSKNSQDFIEYGYDAYGRLTLKNDRGRKTIYSYKGTETTTIYPDSTKSSVKLDSTGLVSLSTDAAGVTVRYVYNSSKKPVTIIVDEKDSTVVGYDSRGNRESLKDPNMSRPLTYKYDAYNRLRTEINARNQVTTYQYDELNRIKKISRPEEVLDYDYVTSGDGRGKLKTVKRNNSVVRSFLYNKNGNVLSETETVDAIQYQNSYTYDEYYRLKTHTTPSGLQLLHTYDDNGFLAEIRNNEGGQLLWQLNAMNAMGKAEQSTFGNGLKRITGFDEYGQLSFLGLQKDNSYIDQVGYTFDPRNGNLLNRNDVTNFRDEVFGYDDLRRLSTIQLNGGKTDSIHYEPNGNIARKYNVGDYAYTGHAVTSIENPVASYTQNNGNTAYDYAYNSLNRIDTITQRGSVTKRLVFIYGDDGQRRAMKYLENNSLKRTRYYCGNYEKEVSATGETKEYDYLYTPDGLIIANKTGSVRSFSYVHTDHLGSIRTVTDATKNIRARYYYDAWGIRTLAGGTDIEPRGFTGHEHLTDFGLINMNSRLYNPELGRFLGIDPYIQLPDYSQNYNRYAYALNNPLVYIDPSGEIIEWFIIGGALIGAYLGASIKGESFNPTKWSGQWWKGMLWGGLAGGAVGAFVGSAWVAGASLSFGVNIGSLKTINLITFSAATAAKGGMATLAIGGGLGFGSSLCYSLGRLGKVEQKDMIAFDYGTEWLTGIGSKNKYLTEEDYFTQELMQSSHIQETREMIIEKFYSSGLGLYKNNRNLSKHLDQYFVDAYNVITGGRSGGNMAQTYLGSYELYFDITSYDAKNHSIQVNYYIFNGTTVGSGTRPPMKGGYSTWWESNVVRPLNNHFGTSGPMSKQTQNITWSEKILLER